MRHKDARSIPAAAQQVLRERVVTAVRGGMTHAHAAQVFGVARGTVSRWMGLWREDGARALAARRRGRPPRPRLDAATTRRVVRLILGRCPDQLGLPFALWTRAAVRQLLRDRLGVAVSLWTVGRYLKAWGLTPQKPVRRAYQQDPARMGAWLKREYPEIAAAAKACGAEIHWGDEMGLRSDHYAGRSYGRRGHTPVIPATGLRFGCNMLSTVTNRGTLAFMIFTERFTTRVFLRFLARLLRLRPGMIFLILYGHPVHRARRVQSWVESHKDRLRLFFLPPYCPELNPDELLNQDVKTNAVGRSRPASLGEMVGNVRSYLRITQRRPELVQRYFHRRHVRYALAG